MNLELLQDAVVTLLALGAAILVVRRVFAVVQPASGEPACASCPSAEAHGQKPESATEAAKPLTLVRGDRP